MRIFIGFDRREEEAYRVLARSLTVRASEPVIIKPLILESLPELTRERDPLQSTDFAFSRFLTPFLSGYNGWSIFMDCDMLCVDDIAKLWSLRDDDYAVMVVKHNHVPRETVKFLGSRQTTYEKKNWSSLMLFNNRKCGALTPEYVNTASGLDLHQFKWLKDDFLIGSLPGRWNYLVGHDKGDASLIHYTTGGPWFGYDCEYAKEWFLEAKQENEDGQKQKLQQTA